MNTVPDQADLPDLADLADLAEMVSATAARSLPSTRAGGQDYGSLTNSLKQAQLECDDVAYELFEAYSISETHPVLMEAELTQSASWT